MRALLRGVHRDPFTMTTCPITPTQVRRVTRQSYFNSSKRRFAAIKSGVSNPSVKRSIGARIITFFKSDVERIDAIVRSFFKPIEFRDRVPESQWEFGYFGRHYVLIVPTDVKSDSIDSNKMPDFFELQVRTLFQHAWSEADHDVGYKPGSIPLTPEEVRKLAYTSAQAWGAAQIFDELFQARSFSAH